MLFSKKRKQYLLAGIVMLATQHSSHAQIISVLDSVEIRENRLSFSFRDQNRHVQILDKKQIASLPVKSTTELLSYINGVDLRQRGPSGTQADISIDGSSFDQVLVLVNGVKMSDPQTGHHILNLPVPLAAIERIEVLRGAAAKIYGVNALAGAVNIITRTPEKHEISAQLYTGSSFKEDTSNGKTFYNTGAQVAAGLAYKKHTHQLALSHDKGNGYRYNTAYELYRILYNNEIRLDTNNTLEITGGYISNDFGAGLFYAAPADNEAIEHVQTATAGIRHTLQVHPRIKISPRVSYRYNKDDYIYIRQDPGVYRNIHETNVLTAEIQGSIQLKKGTAGTGVEYRNEAIHSSGLGGRHDRDNLGVYAEYKHWFSPQFNAGAGLYANFNSDYNWQLFPGVDIGYHFLHNWKIFASASSGQRLPTYTDLYYNGPGNMGNDKLLPEQATFAEGGLQYNRHFLRLQGSWSWRQTTGFIDWIKNDLADKWQPHNFQEVYTRALSFRADYFPGRHNLLPQTVDISLHAGYTYLDLSLQVPADKISKYAIDALRHQLTASLRCTFYKKLQVNLNSRYQYRISANDYTLLDTRIALLFPHWNLYADINNLLDTQYRELAAIPLPGRWFTLGIQARI